ncbi:MAG: porin [Alphaproteobacteria bacterium]|nr:porin [Alphaproteobacteria bacterium]MDA7988887.1 porin [Alphaproteobacteria bacterium]
MKKFLYSTTALVGAAFLIGDVSVARADVMSGTDFTISGDARYRYVSSSADTQHETGDARSTYATSRARVHISAKRDHPNGLTTGFTLSGINLSSADGDDTDNALGFIEGSFGKIQLGAQHAATYAMGSPGIPGATGFGALDDGQASRLLGKAESPEINGSNEPGAYIVSPFDPGGVGYRASQRIGYYTPSISGFQAGFTYAGEGGEGNAGDAVDSEDEVVDTFSFAVTYSTDFNDVGMSLSAGYAAGSYQQKTPWPTVAAVTAAPGVEAVDAKDADAVATDIVDALSISDALGVGAAKTPDNMSVVGTGNTDPNAPAVAGLVNHRIGQDPTSLGMAAGFTFGDFGFSGTWGQQDVTDGGEITVFALGGTYSMDAFTFGLSWANQETQRAGYVIDASDGSVSYQAAGGALYESDTVAFTVNYAVGDGANIGFVLETNDYARTGSAALSGTGGSTVHGRRTVEDSRTGFGVGVNLSF